MSENEYQEAKLNYEKHRAEKAINKIYSMYEKKAENMKKESSQHAMEKESLHLPIKKNLEMYNMDLPQNTSDPETGQATRLFFALIRRKKTR